MQSPTDQQGSTRKRPQLQEEQGQESDIPEAKRRNLLKFMQKDWPAEFGKDMSTTKSASTVSLPSCSKWDPAWGSPPCGPFSAGCSLTDWPEHICEQLCQSIGLDRVKSAMADHQKAGIHVTSHCSGLGTGEVATEYAVQGIMKSLGLDVGPDVHLHSSCDISEACRKVLLNHGHSKHIFGDNVSRLPTDIQEVLKKKLQNYQAKLQNKLKVVPEKAKSEARIELIDSLGDKWLADAKKILGSVKFHRNMRATCFKCHRACMCFPSSASVAGGLLLEVAGTTCVAFSAMSQQSMKWLDPSSIPFLTWCYTMKSILPDVVVHECVPRFDVSIFEKLLGPSGYTVSSIVFDPTDIGHPAHRSRRYTVCILTNGPEKTSQLLDYNLPSFRQGVLSTYRGRWQGPLQGTSIRTRCDDEGIGITYAQPGHLGQHAARHLDLCDDQGRLRTFVVVGQVVAITMAVNRGLPLCVLQRQSRMSATRPSAASQAHCPRALR